MKNSIAVVAVVVVLIASGLFFSKMMGIGSCCSMAHHVHGAQ